MAFKKRGPADKHALGTKLNGTIRLTASKAVGGTNEFTDNKGNVTTRQWIAVTVGQQDTIAQLPPWLELDGSEAPGDEVRLEVVDKFDKNMNPTGNKAYQVIG